MSRDDLYTLLGALGPGAMGAAMAVAGLFLRLPSRYHSRVWIASFTFILLQAALLIFASVIFGGAITLNPFTMIGGSGLLVDIAALIAYAFKAFRSESKPPHR